MWKKFDKDDWMAFSGAESFTNEQAGWPTEPLANYRIKVDGLDAVAVVDANGLYLQVLTPDGEDVALFTGGLTQAILFVAASSPSGGATYASFDTGELVDMGLDEERAN